MPKKRFSAEQIVTLLRQIEVKAHPGTDAVLVSVDSIAALQRAYPNYFADTRVFVALLKQALSGHQRRIFTGGLKLELLLRWRHDLLIQKPDRISERPPRGGLSVSGTSEAAKPRERFSGP